MDADKTKKRDKDNGGTNDKLLVPQVSLCLFFLLHLLVFFFFQINYNYYKYNGQKGKLLIINVWLLMISFRTQMMGAIGRQKKKEKRGLRHGNR